MKLTEHFKERFGGRMVNFQDIEDALKEKPTQGEEGRLIYTGEKLVVITDSETEYLITCYENKANRERVVKPKRGVCEKEDCKRKTMKYSQYCKLHFKTIK